MLAQALYNAGIKRSTIRYSLSISFGQLTGEYYAELPRSPYQTVAWPSLSNLTQVVAYGKFAFRLEEKICADLAKAWSS